MTKKALISGIAGQDGSYLTEYLVSMGYNVYGIVRRHSVAENQNYRLHHLNDRDDVYTFYGDLLDYPSLVRIFNEVKPDEIYNLAAMSHVRISFDVRLLRFNRMLLAFLICWKSIEPCVLKQSFIRPVPPKCLAIL